ncbi:double-strand break repair protein AddB, partial [Litorisediminicola beolgyonensis]
RTEALVAGPAGGAEALWDRAEGRGALKVMEALAAEAEHGTDLDARGYADLFEAVLSRAEPVRRPDEAHPQVLIWGTIEARVMGADLLILGGLNEGSWPEVPAADPWLNRAMRAELGLLLPERRIGLSAHDFQQAAAAREVWFTRAARSDEAETVPARWLNRITNLMSGLPGRQGPEALAAMRARGQGWLSAARALERAEPVARAPRPAPVPPVEVRPRKLSVTEIRTLIRDPYAIYARHVLRLRPLDPLQPEPDALMRGTALHDAMEAFVGRSLHDPDALTPAEMRAEIARQLDALPFPLVRHLWAARVARVAESFCAEERERQAVARPGVFERKGRGEMADPAFTLTCKADRIDIDDGGNALIYDYKTGRPPTPKEQRHFDKQLLLEAALAERGGFDDLGPMSVRRAAYIGLGAEGGEVEAPLRTDPAEPFDPEKPRLTPAEIWAEFEELMRRYFDPGQGFTARRAMREDRMSGDYDQLARLGEWELSDAPEKQVLR